MDKTPIDAPENFEWIVSAEPGNITNAFAELKLITNLGRVTRLLIKAFQNGIWNFCFRADNTAEPLPEDMLVDALPVQADLTYSEKEDLVMLKSGGSIVEINPAEWDIQFKKKHGPAYLRGNPADVDGLGRPFTLPLGGVFNDDKAERVTSSFYLRPDEKIYGLGEKFTPLNKTGQNIVTWTLDAFGSTSERSHKNIPFMISSAGYGLFYHSGARITWELGTRSFQSYTVTGESSVMDLFVIPAGSPAGIIEKYTSLTGRAPVPPKWTFGLWVSSGGTYRDEKAMRELVEGLEKHDIPADVVHLDPWWMKWRLYCDFKWNREAFPDPQKFTGYLHDKNLKLCLWEHSYISVESELFEKGKENGWFVTRPDGEVYIIDYGLSLAPRPDGIVRVAEPETSWNARVAIIDLTNPEAYEWFKDLHRPVFKSGADIFKTDFGEDIPEDAVFYNGQTGKTMHNLYPLYYNKAVFEVTREETGYGAVWARSGTAGNQRYPICWSGDPASDYESLASTIRGGLSIGLSGVPFWSHDIGGYRGMPTPELYVRWAQFGLMCSHSRMHADSPREPWHFGDETLEIVRKYIKLRYKLFPYFYSLAIEASLTGMPVIRAMPLAFPDDPNTPDKEFQFMLGDAILAAPVFRGSGRIVYLPEGSWINYHTGERFDGKDNIYVPVPLDVMPIFVRAGAVLPQMPESYRIPEEIIDPLLLEIFPQGSGRNILLEDEGKSYFDIDTSSESVKLRISGHRLRNYIIKIRGSRKYTLAVIYDENGEASGADKAVSAGDDSQVIELEQVNNITVELK